jgi:hypothetical protein
MKTMKQLLFFLSCFALLLASCSKADSNNTDTPEYIIDDMYPPTDIPDKMAENWRLSYGMSLLTPTLDAVDYFNDSITIFINQSEEAVMSVNYYSLSGGKPVFPFPKGDYDIFATNSNSLQVEDINYRCWIISLNDYTLYFYSSNPSPAVFVFKKTIPIPDNMLGNWKLYQIRNASAGFSENYSMENVIINVTAYGFIYIDDYSLSEGLHFDLLPGKYNIDYGLDDTAYSNKLVISELSDCCTWFTLDVQDGQFVISNDANDGYIYSFTRIE